MSVGKRPGGAAKQKEDAKTQQEAPSLPSISRQHGVWGEEWVCGGWNTRKVHLISSKRQRSAFISICMIFAEMVPKTLSDILQIAERSRCLPNKVKCCTFLLSLSWFVRKAL